MDTKITKVVHHLELKIMMTLPLLGCLVSIYGFIPHFISFAITKLSRIADQHASVDKSITIRSCEEQKLTAVSYQKRLQKTQKVIRNLQRPIKFVETRFKSSEEDQYITNVKIQYR